MNMGAMRTSLRRLLRKVHHVKGAIRFPLLLIKPLGARYRAKKTKNHKLATRKGCLLWNVQIPTSNLKLFMLLSTMMAKMGKTSLLKLARPSLQLIRGLLWKGNRLHKF
jgi:hypothetical protein